MIRNKQSGHPIRWDRVHDENVCTKRTGFVVPFDEIPLT